MTVLTIAIVLLAAGVYVLTRQHIVVLTAGCESDGGGGNRVVMLDTGQAAIAATIAGVATSRKLPAHAVTIAYATAWQESHLQDLDYGTLDSIGVFQQRPSEGWGSPKELIDPVYATGKFFAALVKVPGYLRLPTYVAAQDVQHSADGSAYTNYADQAAWMSGPFTGGTPHAVWCWYPRDSATSPQITSLRQELTHTFGRLDVRQSSVRVRYVAAGWAVASWLVTHATTYGLTNVSFAGYQWSVSAGNRGWTHDPSAPRGSVELR
ncbi:MAG: hypothetical protein ACRDNF_13235 [Streptosporangiaceae bacterium]